MVPSMDDLIEHLRRQLDRPLPGETAQYRMAPPARPRAADAQAVIGGFRQSAVLLYLFPHDAEWRIVLMKRAADAGPHSGQISIPGGQVESGENHLQAALREFGEETGVAVEQRQLLGELSALHIPVSRFLVQPFVAHAVARPVFDPDPVEVAAIIEMPLAVLLDDSSTRHCTMQIRGRTVEQVPYFDVDGHRVWGATAMILSELKALLLTR
jgi:8-oxo-dGTP pyrophosphatase MutT (NUDIX family)